MPEQPFKRPLYSLALKRVREPRRFIQVLAGPRQVGKTTLARQLVEAAGLPFQMASADEPGLGDRTWIDAQWQLGRLRARESRRGALLVLDEIQKVPGWSEVVKRLWDEDTASGAQVRVLLLGSSPLLVQHGLTESLAGRFELIRVPHWGYSEMRDAFDWDLDRYVYFGGYPGAAPLIRDEGRWRRYVLDSLVETTISRDVLLHTRVDKPALLRQLFRLACDYSGQVLSFTKMIGQLQDAGNTTTIAHYLDLLGGSGMVTGLQKYSGSRVRQRASSPKLNVLNTALMNAVADRSFATARHDADWWGRIVESAIGAHLMATCAPDIDVGYWRDGNREVDFVLSGPKGVVAFEVASGRRKTALPGLTAFTARYENATPLLVGAQGIPLEEFLLRPGDTWLG